MQKATSTASEETVPHYGVIFHRDGTRTVLKKGHIAGRFGGSTMALNHANRNCQEGDTYSAVEASNYKEAAKKVEKFYG